MQMKTGMASAVAALVCFGLAQDAGAESRERGINPPSGNYMQNSTRAQGRQGGSFFEIFGGIGNSRSGRSPFDFGYDNTPPDNGGATYVPVEDTTGAPIYTYRADPLVQLVDSSLKEPTAEFSVDGDERMGASYRAINPITRSIYEDLKTGGTATRVTTAQRDAIIDFYRERNFQPVWVSEGSISEKADKVLALFSDANSEGLDAGDYLPSALNSYSADHSAVEDSDVRLAELDIGLTAMALRYAMHASGGRIIPNRLSGYYDVTPPVVMPGKALKEIAGNEDAAGYLASLQPVHPAYAALKVALAEEMRAGEDVRKSEPIPEGALIRVGDFDERVPAIRDRLQELGALDGSDDAEQIGETPSAENDVGFSTGANSEDLLYNRDLARAVKRFQDQAGLSRDGIVGSRTLAVLNGEQVHDRKERLIYNMERLRWLPRDLGSRYVFVNQAAFQLKVIDNGNTVWTTKVIIGKPSNQTFVFNDQMETVEFNPYWGVPQSIIRNEMIPKLVNDPGYLDREGYEVFTGSGRQVSSYNVSWWNYDSNAPMSVRQPPGPGNALGQIKFLFPNKHAIYMHDTPMKKLFSRSVRAFSHGCVRVEDPRRFAEVVLGWDRSEIDAAIAQGNNQPTTLKRKLPVYLTYFTAWPDDQGNVHYLSDVYGRDKLMEKALGVTETAMR